LGTPTFIRSHLLSHPVRRKYRRERQPLQTGVFVFITTNSMLETSLPGVFAAGDVRL
jgi:pyruvate/2-oxoglutarate dehydrogenase complex dihydrolipoamide dehydrogenase (E3) component